METVLDALPGQPLTAEDVAALNEAPTVRLIPYTWYGEQVIAALLLHDQRRHADSDQSTADDQMEQDGESESEDGANHEEPDREDAAAKQTDSGFDTTSSSGFGTRNRETVGTVEVIGDDSLAPESKPTDETNDQQNPADSRADRETETDDAADPTAADDRLSSDEPDTEKLADDSGDDLHVYAAGYNDTDGAWVVIAEIDPDSEFTDAEPLIREWLTETYPDQIVDRLAVGPSEYEL